MQRAGPSPSIVVDRSEMCVVLIVDRGLLESSVRVSDVRGQEVTVCLCAVSCVSIVCGLSKLSRACASRPVPRRVGLVVTILYSGPVRACVLSEVEI